MAKGPDAEETIDGLKRQLQAALAERDESQAQQAAMAEVLQAINASTGDLAPVFDTILEKTRRLCDAAYGDLWTYDGKMLHLAACHGEPGFEAWLRAQGPVPIWPGSPTEVLLQGADHVQYEDPVRDGNFEAVPEFGAQVERAGIRSNLFVPMWKDSTLLGVLIFYRREVRRFTNKQIAVLQGFAAQAVIAMENARLITEQREALEQQTATADILRVISQSPTDVRPVLDAVAQAACRFCGADNANIHMKDGDELVTRASASGAKARDYLGTLLGNRIPIDRRSAAGRAILEGHTVHLPNVMALDPAEYGKSQELAGGGGFNSLLCTPLLRDGVAIGVITLPKVSADPFTPRQIALLESFAAQAVIAIENVRLFTELKESLDQQTATADILRVISQSPTNVNPVLDVVVKAAQRFCGADDVVISLRDGNELAIAAHDGPIEAPPPRRKLDRSSTQGRAIIDAQTIHLPDVSQVDPAEWSTVIALTQRFGAKASLAAPMLREGTAIGAIMLRRREAGEFSDRQIALLEAFAAQAVIAIENVRLFTELKESLDQQTATADILRVIAQSPTDVAPVLDAVAEATLRFCGAEDVAIDIRDGEIWRCVAHAGILKSPVGMTNAIGRKDLPSRTMLDRAVTQIPDIEATTDPETEFDRMVGRQVGFRAAMAAPMMRQDEALGALIIHRTTPGAFTARQVELLENFAAQGVIALQNVRLFTELKESLDQQTATSDILRVISQSPTDVSPVLDAVTKAVLRFCGAEDAVVVLREGEQMLIAGHEGPMVGEVGTHQPLNRQSAPGRATLDGMTTHFADIADLDPVEFAAAHAFAKRHGFQAALAAPLLRDGAPIGAIALRRSKPGAFTPRQIELLENFAAQAVIALENVRLFTELTESLDQQTATSEILRVISQSPTDVQPVLKAVAKASLRFCGAIDSVIILRDGEQWTSVAHEGPLTVPLGIRRALNRQTAPGRAMMDRQTVHYPDIAALDPAEHATERSNAAAMGFGAVIAAPLMRDNESIGAIGLRKREAGAFTPRQIELLENFAAQAVIAIQNVRLFTELQERTDDLTESLEYQTATSELLEVISRSTSDVQPVLDTMLASAARLCEAGICGVVVKQRDGFWYQALRGGSAELFEALRAQPIRPERGTVAGHTLMARDVVHVDDVHAYPDYTIPEVLKAARTILGVPLMREGDLLGAIVLTRDHVEPFTERQIGLVKTFADQSVIAMENARLLSELHQRTDDLTQSLEYQTATSELLEVISRSTSDIQPVLDTMLASAARLCGAALSGIVIRQDGEFRYRAILGGSPEVQRAMRAIIIVPGRATIAGRVLKEARAIHVTDLTDDPDYALPEVRAEARTILGVPLMRDGEAIGSITLTRGRVETFTERQITLVKTFADQAVIAMENARLLSELRESLDQQTATAEILRVINTSPGNLTPVFQAILEKAHSTCGADMGSLFTWDGIHVQAVVTMGYSAEVDAILRQRHPPPDWVAEFSTGMRFFHRAYERERPSDSRPHPFGPKFLAESRIRTNLIIPLRKDDAILGFISANRRDVRPYSDKEIALLENFAAQAVIAMENARLLSELRERTDDLTQSLEYQTATSEVLEVISRSAGDLQPVLDAMLTAAGRLCGANSGGIVVRRDEGFRYASVFGLTPEAAAATLAADIKPGRATMAGRALLAADVVHESDLMADPDYQLRAVVPECRSSIGVPLMRDGAPIGVFVLNRGWVEPFAERQIDLVRTFADQAVIAMENARLLGELTRREEELRVTFDHMGDGVAMFGADHKLASWNRNYQELLDIPDTFLAVRPGLDEYIRLLVERGELGHGDAEEQIALYRQRIDQQWSTERVRPDGRVIEVRNNPVPGGGAVLIYSDITERKKAEAEIASARDAAEAALERQTATADILKVIASSPTDVQPVLDAVAKAAVRFCGAADSLVHLREGDKARLTAHEGEIEVGPMGMLLPLTRDHAVGRAIVDAAACHIPDYDRLDPADWPTARALSRDHGHKAGLAVPMLRENTAVGAIMLRKSAPEPFTPQQIELLETFAAQAVIAIENVRLFTELRDSLERLKAAQANLVQSEKMASLGQLTAGIAHEIKNPLNFVNNFATLSVDLLDELKEVAGPALATLDDDKRAEVDETMELLVGNLGKIAEHGKRADGIVKSMLSHSRGGAGDWTPSDINALVEEALNLAYHGARSQDKEFNVTLERDLGKAGAPIEVVPQDVTRVFLNLFGNGFYAANKRRMAAMQSGFRPTLKVTTRDLGEMVEVRVRDNGTGMPPEVKEKLFQPFFTTKPTGEGTGLGLSISYDIVTQQHGGTIEVESEPNNYTEFTVRLPRARRVVPAERV